MPAPDGRSWSSQPQSQLMIRLSPTAINQFLGCPMLDYWERDQRLEPITTPRPLQRGRAIARALEPFNRGDSVEFGLREVDSVFSELELDDRTRTEHAKARAAVIGYWGLWSANRNKYTNVESEVELTWPLIDGVEMYVRLDMVGKLNGSQVIRETKTSSNRQGEYLTKVNIDSQINAQLASWGKVHGKLPDTLEYDILYMSQLRKGVKETWAAYGKRLETEYLTREDMFRREPYKPNKRHVLSWLKDAKRIAEFIVHTRANKTWWKNTGHCLQWNTACSWLPACEQGQANPMLYRKREYKK